MQACCTTPCSQVPVPSAPPHNPAAPSCFACLMLYSQTFFFRLVPALKSPKGLTLSAALCRNMYLTLIPIIFPQIGSAALNGFLTLLVLTALYRNIDLALIPSHLSQNGTAVLNGVLTILVVHCTETYMYIIYIYHSNSKQFGPKTGVRS